MKKLVMFLGALALVFGVMGSAAAYTDNRIIHEKLGMWESYPIDFNFTVSGTISDATLSLSLVDDQDSNYELASVKYDGDTWTGIPSAWANVTLDNGDLYDGKLSVVVKSLWGDFWLETAGLSVNFKDDGYDQGGDNGNGNPVPEPATMILLGSGLAGLAGLRKKFKK